MKLKKSITKAFTAYRGSFLRAELEQPGETLDDWLEGWERAVRDGHSRISRAEAIRRWEQEQDR